jgi:hypothetical protein
MVQALHLVNNFFSLWPNFFHKCLVLHESFCIHPAFSLVFRGEDAPRQALPVARLCPDSPTRFTGLTGNRPSKVLEIKRFLICARLGARAYRKFTPPPPASRGGWRAYNLTDTDLCGISD